MELIDLLRTLGAAETSDLVDILEPHWEESRQSVPETWDLLGSDHWRQNREWTGCEERCDAVLDHLTQIIAARPELKLLAWHCHRLAFDTADYGRCREWTRFAPLLDQIETGISPVFFLWLALGAAPRLRKQNAQRGISDDITRATLWDIGIVQRRFARYNANAVGIEPHLLTWHHLVASGDLHRVGRFEYVARPFRGRLRAFRNRQNGQVCALSLPDVEYTNDGYFPYSDQTPDWTSILRETKSTFTGHLVSPCGFAQRATISLEKADWQEVLKPGDLALEIHIPEGEALSKASCKDSFSRAIDFYQTHYPEYAPLSFVCYSWLFNTQFETLFGPQSNIVKWQRECSLFPVASTGKDGLYFVFGQFDIDPATAPRDSKLRRAIADHLQSGKKLRNGGMFFLFDDLQKYGTQFYRGGIE